MIALGFSGPWWAVGSENKMASVSLHEPGVKRESQKRSCEGGGRGAEEGGDVAAAGGDGDESEGGGAGSRGWVFCVGCR